MADLILVFLTVFVRKNSTTWVRTTVSTLTLKMAAVALLFGEMTTLSLLLRELLSQIFIPNSCVIRIQEVIFA